MKIAVTAKGAGLGAWLDPIFEACMQIVIVDDRNSFDAWMNPFREAEPLDGVALAQKLVEEKVDALITGEILPPALDCLRSAGIKVFTANQGSILELVEAARLHALSSLA